MDRVSETEFGLNIAGGFTLLLGNFTDGIFDDILILRIEDLAFPEGESCEDDEDEPSSTDEHDHDGMPNKEPVQFEDVTESSDSGDPANCK